MKLLHADGKREFIFKKLKDVCTKKDIMIKYTILYLYKENELAEQG